MVALDEIDDEIDRTDRVDGMVDAFTLISVAVPSFSSMASAVLVDGVDRWTGHIDERDVLAGASEIAAEEAAHGAAAAKNRDPHDVTVRFSFSRPPGKPISFARACADVRTIR